MTISRRKLIQVAGVGAAALTLPKKTFAAKKTLRKYFGFSDMFVPDPINYRLDLFQDVGGNVDSWDNIRKYGKMIKDKTGVPVGIGQAAEIDTAMAMRAVLYAFGGGEQDEQGNIVLNSRQTVEAVKFVKALYQEAMTPEVLSWDASSNNRAMLAGKSSVVLNAISVTREGENKNMTVDGSPIADRIGLAKAAKGPARRMGLEHVMSNFVIWKFAENIEGAKKFLVDLIGNFHRAYDASEYYNFPCFPKQVPDLKETLANDKKGKPAGKYSVLADAQQWATNVGYPGYANAAIDEIYSTWVLNTMFGQASTGAMSPEDAVKEADAKCRKIWQKWKERKLL